MNRTNEKTSAGQAGGFPISCGRVVVGDHVRWTEPVFAGERTERRCLGTRTIEAVVVEDRYGELLPPDAVTLVVTATDDGVAAPPVGTVMRLRGRSLWRRECRRREWGDETRRWALIDRKHGRRDRSLEARPGRRGPRLVYSADRSR